MLTVRCIALGISTMADETTVASGKRFCQDLRRIREDRDISIDEVRKETRIARTLLESFEEGGLYDHETFNEVYLRSLVQAYAEAVGLPPETARTELDAALQGTYQSALADQYLTDSTQTDDVDDEQGDDEVEGTASAPPDRSSSPDESSSSPSPSEAGEPGGRDGIVGPAREIGEGRDEEKRAEEEESVLPASEGAEEDDQSEEADAEADEASSGLPSGEAPSQESSPDFPSESKEAPEEDGEDDPGGLSEERRPSWMEEGDEGEDPTARDRSEGEREAGAVRGGEEVPPPPAGETGETGIVGEPTPMGSDAGDRPAATPSGAATPTNAPGRTRRQTGWSEWVQDERREIVWAGIGFVVVLLVLVGLGIAFFTGESEPASQQATSASTAPAVDTAASSGDTTQSSPTDQSRPPPANVTLGSSIPLTVRATRDVQGIRIERDEDLARPYWIEEGEAAVFPFQNRVILDNELANVQLFLAGYPYPEPATEGRIVITRSEVDAFVDTLRGAPAALTTPPDTIPKGPPDQ